jgi:hypothetical protein
VNPAKVVMLQALLVALLAAPGGGLEKNYCPPRLSW